MSSGSLEPRPWSSKRWILLIGLVFAAHVGFIFAFGEHKPIATRAPSPATRLSLAPESSEWIALTDPTLFALPHRRSFSGAAWLKIPEIPFQHYRWTDPPRLLGLPVAQLGETFLRFMQTNASSTFAFQTKPAPQPLPLNLPDVSPAIAARSAYRLTGDLAMRRWLNAPTLRSYESADLLTNTVVQVAVLADGTVFSAKVLPLISPPGAPGSGSTDADRDALHAAESARFSPARTGEKLAVGNIVFEWATVPLSATNASNAP